MAIGYACLALGVPGSAIGSCRMKSCDEERLTGLIAQNLDALETMADYNARMGIRLYRISSDIIPFASSPVNDLSWDRIFAGRLAEIGGKIRRSGMRVSMHPGQYTVLNSPDPGTVRNAVADIEYHVKFLDGLGMDASNKIILHMGGAYGDKKRASARFEENFRELDSRIRARIVIENDDRSFGAADVLETGVRLGIPVVFDTLHQAVNGSPGPMDAAGWIRECAKTWRSSDGRPKIHYSQQDPGGRPGSHSRSIGIDGFLDFWDSIGSDMPDIMLEVKDKNISAVKCILCTSDPCPVGMLEREWGRYKYAVMERSPRIYAECRSLFRDPPEQASAAVFFHLAEDALRREILPGNAANAAMHVWGYFKDRCSAKEKQDFLKKCDSYVKGNASLASVKNILRRLTMTYREEYLLDSYYFDLSKS